MIKFPFKSVKRTIKHARYCDTENYSGLENSLEKKRLFAACKNYKRMDDRQDGRVRRGTENCVCF